jgi:hypothetical protein
MNRVRPELESLFTFAEIGIALAGFASLVGVVGSRRGGDHPILDANRLRNMVDTSLMVVIFALLPIVPYQFGMSDATVWRLCSVLYLFAVIAFMVVAKRRQERLAARNIRISVAFARMLWVLGAAVTGTLVFGVVAAPSGRGGAIYNMALLLSLVVSCTIFTLVLASILMPIQTDDAES